MHIYFLKELYQSQQNQHQQQNPNNNDEEVVFKNCTSFTDCISEINHTQLDELIEYSNNYSKVTGSSWQYYRDETFLDYNDAIADFPTADNNSASFIFKQKITGQRVAVGKKYVKIMVPLKYLRNF